MVNYIDTVDLTRLDATPSRRKCELSAYGAVYSVTGSPSGAILLDAISDNLEFPGYRNDNLLIGHLETSDFREVDTPWTEPEAVVMSIRWDGVRPEHGQRGWARHSFVQSHSGPPRRATFNSR